DAGLHRITVSLDTLRRDRFEALTRRNHLDKVLAGLQTARETGFEKIKLDCVIVRGTNEDELTDLIEFGRRLGAEIRFIEYMDVGGATRWSMDKVFSKAEMLKTLARRYGRIETIDEESWSPARRFVFADGAEEIAFGIIASTTEPFCRTCDRSRLTADGLWYLCLYARQGVDLREPLRRGASREEMLSIIQGRWTARTDRGAEQRQEMAFRQALVQPEGLRKDPHLEMHTRGG
ncbi:MAG: radical SAM protein, partial [Acidobacteriota bacterium]